MWPNNSGTFIEFRNGMLNISPIGRNCSRDERNAFEEFDKGAGVRKTMVAAMEKEFGDLKLKFSIGGQVSVLNAPHTDSPACCASPQLRPSSGLVVDVASLRWGWGHVGVCRSALMYFQSVGTRPTACST